MVSGDCGEDAAALNIQKLLKEGNKDEEKNKQNPRSDAGIRDGSRLPGSVRK